MVIIFDDRDTYIDSTSIPRSGKSLCEMQGVICEFRTCNHCHSTLLIQLADLRDYSKKGIMKRESYRLR